MGVAGLSPPGPPLPGSASLPTRGVGASLLRVVRLLRCTLDHGGWWLVAETPRAASVSPFPSHPRCSPSSALRGWAGGQEGTWGVWGCNGTQAWCRLQGVPSARSVWFLARPWGSGQSLESLSRRPPEVVDPWMRINGEGGREKAACAAGSMAVVPRGQSWGRCGSSPWTGRSYRRGAPTGKGFWTFDQRWSIRFLLFSSTSSLKKRKRAERGAFPTAAAALGSASGRPGLCLGGAGRKVLSGLQWMRTERDLFSPSPVALRTTLLPPQPALAFREGAFLLQCLWSPGVAAEGTGAGQMLGSFPLRMASSIGTGAP